MNDMLEQFLDHIRSPALFAEPNLTFQIHVLSDAGLKGASPILFLRRSGTGGIQDDIVQQTDIDVTVLVDNKSVKAGEELCFQVMKFLKSEAGFCKDGRSYVVYSPMIGPNQIANGKHRFSFVVRCFSEDL